METNPSNPDIESRLMNMYNEAPLDARPGLVALLNQEIARLATHEANQSVAAREERERPITIVT